MSDLVMSNLVINSVSDYVAEVLTTELFPAHLTNIPEAPKWQWRWFHGTTGLVSEQSELLSVNDSVNLFEEIGDRFWYHGLTSAVVTELGLGCPLLAAVSSVGSVTFSDITRVDAQLADLSKRLMFYTKKPKPEQLYAAAMESAAATVRYCRANGIDVLTCMNGNILKLRKRKHDADRKKLEMGDMNRDLAGERTVLTAAATGATES